MKPDPDLFLNRELSWLDFHERVLAMAIDSKRPLLERVRFCAIVSDNLDEFFQIRVSAVAQQVTAGITQQSPDGKTPDEILLAVRTRANGLINRLYDLFRNELRPALVKEGLVFVRWAELSDSDREQFHEVFERDVFPILTPLALDPSHPFPFISNLSLNLAVIIDNGAHQFARLKIPPLLPRFFAVSGSQQFLPVDELIAANLDALFPGMSIVDHHPFRVTRNADLDLEDETSDLITAVEDALHQRTRSGDVVRLEVTGDMPHNVVEFLTRELNIEPAFVIKVNGPLDLSSLWHLYDLPRPELKDPAWTPQTQPAFAETDRPPDLFATLRKRDLLVHHPYDSFVTSVERFIEQAARDPQVVAIKVTLYRTASEEGSIVHSLISAAEAGKQVVALVELTARFEEQANIERARALEQAGVHVVYGVVGLKTHAKVTLIVRHEKRGLARYCHIGTGNYNPKTARMYEDLGIFTADPDIGADLSELFNWLTGFSRQDSYRKLVVAPHQFRTRLTSLINQESKKGSDGHITFKINNLSDSKIIHHLAKASQNGTQVQLICRSACCIRPETPELTENVSVRSLVGRFLEHSRIYRFGSPGNAQYFIGSADLMPRNLDRRVEVLMPITDAEHCAYLDTILDLELRDDELAWKLHSDGSWERVPISEHINAQATLQQSAYERAHQPVRVEPYESTHEEGIEVRAAGGVVTRRHLDELQVLIIHRPKYADWSFPKGKLDPGESYEDAAEREVTEETGLVAARDYELPAVHYRDTRDRAKLVRYWMMHVQEDAQEFSPNSEVDEIRWCGPAEALRILTYERDRELLRQIQALS